MKTEFTDVSETQKTLTIEIPSDVVDAEIDRVAQGTTRSRRECPASGPGKVPPTIVKQRFRDQILHDVMHGLIPRAVDEALQERGIEPVDTPEHQGRRAPGRAAADVHGADRNRAPVRSRRPVDDRAPHAAVRAITDDAVDTDAASGCASAPPSSSPSKGGRSPTATRSVLDIERTDPDGEVRPPRGRHRRARRARQSARASTRSLIGLNPGDDEDVHHPLPRRLRGQGDGGHRRRPTRCTVKEIRRQVLPELDDEFAKDLGEFESLAALRDRVRADLQAEAEEHAQAAGAHRPAEAARRSGSRSSCPPRWSSARSTGGSRSSPGS